MKNYRPYQNPIPINFAYDNSNLTIIEGDNDLGKTTILNAISWCLYDDEPFRNYSNNVFNIEVGNNLNIGEKLSVVVEILMEDNEGNDVTINRTREFKRHDSGIRKVPSINELEIHISSDSSNDKTVENPDKYIETHLPQSLKEYFLFDGERLLDWFSGDTEEVKKAIERLYQSDLIEKLKERVETQKINFNEELREYNDELANLNDQKIALQKSLDDDMEKIEENNRLIDENKRKKKELEDIQKIDGKANDQLELINLLEGQIQDKKDNLSKLTNDHMNFLLGNFSMVLGYPLMEKTLTIENENSVSNSENYNFKDTQQVLKLIETLFNQKKCVCGSDLIEGTTAFSNMNKFKDLVTTLENSNDFDDLQGEIKDLIDQYPNSIEDDIDKFWEKQEEYLSDIGEINEKLAKAEEKYEIIKKDIILEIDGEKIELEEIDQRIATYDDLISRLHAKNLILEENIKDLPKDIEAIETQINLTQSTSEDEQKIKNKISFCEQIEKHADFLRKELGERLHKGIQESVNNEFQAIYNGDGIRNKYKQIIIDESFNISIEKIDGEITTSVDPSSGPQLAVALSFITAINSSSGYKLPQIMDTSLGRWGKRLRNNFSLILPEYLEKNQMVFLFLDSEFDGPFKEEISKYVGREYELNFVNENTTEIKERIGGN